MLRYADINDLDWLATYDYHIKEDKLIQSIQLNQIMMILENGKILGWLRFNLFWDHIPFLNMLFIIEENETKVMVHNSYFFGNLK